MEHVFDEPKCAETELTHPSLPKEVNDFGCQVNTRGEQLMQKSVGTQTPDFFGLCDQGTQTDFCGDENLLPYSEDELDSETETTSPQKDPSYIPSKSEESDDAEEEEILKIDTKSRQIKTPQSDFKFVVFMQQLDELLQRCPACGAVVRKKETATQGSQLCVTLKCVNGHVKNWKSQPMLKGMAAGNLLLASAILLSGSTYTKLASLSEILNLKIFSEKTFYNIQDKYLFPVVKEAWEAEQNTVFAELANNYYDLWLSGDGRCDSPGHNAKYGTYTMIDQHSDKIIDFQIVQVSEVSSSNAMEREGFKRCMENIHNRGADVKVVATDRHVSIRSDIKKNFPNVQHQFDVWHVSKSITKKLTEKAKRKECSELFPWIKSVTNHLWWCADTCEGDKDLLREKWISIVYHTANIHSWDSADLYHECLHPPIPRDEARSKQWLRPGSPAHEALKEVVFDKTLLKDIEQLTFNCHTGPLEVYHSVQLKYLPKRQHFSYKGMVARTQLAALDHNANTGRQQARVSQGGNEGELRYKIVFSKRTKEWVAKPIMEKTTREHLKPIVDAIVERKMQNAAERSARVTAPHIPPNIASTPRPPKADVIAKHRSRFSDL